MSHLHISDVEAGPDLVGGAGGASVLQQKAQQIVGLRCLVSWLLLLAHDRLPSKRMDFETVLKLWPYCVSQKGKLYSNHWITHLKKST